MESLRSQLNMVKMRRIAEKHTTQRKEVVESTTEVVDELPSNLRRFPSPACLICKDAGYTRIDVPFGHPQFGKIQPCSCKTAQLKEQRQERLIKESGILGMDNYRYATFESFDKFAPGMRKAFVQSTDFAECPLGWLLLLGPYGCGKTHLAVAIAKQRVEAGNTVIVQTVPDLLDQLRAAFNPKNEESFNEKFEEMQQVDVLILDDFGAENSTSWATEKLFQLLNYRYNHNRPTVITSNNMTLEGIDPRLRSRMSDTKMVCMVVMEHAEDYRPGRGERHE